MFHHPLRAAAAQTVDGRVRSLRTSVHATLYSRGHQSLVVVSAATAATVSLVGRIVVAETWATALCMGLVAALTAAAVGWVLFVRSVNVLGAAISKPVELLLDRLSDQEGSPYAFEFGRALARQEVEADLEKITRRVRQSASEDASVLAELSVAKENANRESAAKSQFLANMSHELRTPLNAILGYTMLLHEDAAQAEQTTVMADLERIEHAGRNLLAIINDILEIARIETGRAKVHRAFVDVRALMSEIEADFTQLAALSKISFSVKVEKDAEIAITDEAKVRQCLMGLLDNAMKFTQGGEVRLTVSAVVNSGQKMLAFEVADTGVGIAEDQQGKLFTAFYQGDVSQTRKHGGTGLGLAIVKRLSEMLGGYCEVRSALGHGSAFTLMLPPDGSHDQVRIGGGDKESEQLDYLTGLAERGEGPIALVIDDDRAALDLFDRWLSRAGYRVIATADSQSALALARRVRPDVILLDAHMPGRNGYEVIEDLRRFPETAQIPTLLVTVDDDFAKAMKFGATDYLQKPVSEEQLRKSLETYSKRVNGDVLIIEDDDDAAEIMRRTVSQVGFQSRRAINGSDGLQMVLDRRPDVIVLDINLPGIDGFGVIEYLVKNDNLRNIPLIVHSALDLPLDAHRRLSGQGYRFFAKASSSPRQIAQSLKELVA